MSAKKQSQDDHKLSATETIQEIISPIPQISSHKREIVQRPDPTPESTPPNPANMLTSILRQLISSLDIQAALIYTADRSSHSIHLTHHLGVPDQYLIPNLPMEGCILGEVIRKGQIRQIENLYLSCDPLASSMQSLELGQLTAIPIEWQRQAIGALALITDRDRGEINQQELAFAQTSAFQISYVQTILSLLEEEAGHRHMAEALQEASLVVSNEYELEEILDFILAQIVHAFSCETTCIIEFGAKKCHILRSHGYERFGFAKDFLASIQFSCDEYPLLLRLADGETIVIPDTSAEPAWVRHLGMDWVRSWIGVPIKNENETLGILSLSSSQTDAFNQHIARQLSAFSGQTATAIQRARTYQKMRKEQKRLKEIYEIGQRIAGTLDHDLIHSLLLNGAMDAVGGIFGIIYLVQPDQSKRIQALNPINRREELGDLSLNPLILPLVQTIGKKRKPKLERVPYHHGYFWLLMVPLEIGKRLLGVMCVWTPENAKPESAWMNALASAAQQAALALENAEKHAQVQRRLAEMTLLHQVVSAVAYNLEMEGVLKAITEQLHNQLDFPAVQLYLREDEQLCMRQYSGPRPSHEILSINHGLIGRVFRTGMPVIAKDIPNDPEVDAVLEDTRSRLAVPIRLQEKIIGLINIETPLPNQIDIGTLDLLTLLADQLSVALQNASLYEQVRQSITHLEERVRERTLQLEDALEQAQIAEKTKAQFIADVSHELRTPLTNIGLYIDLLDIGDENRRSDYIDTLKRETQRLEALIEQLLSISQLDTRNILLSLKATDVNSLIHLLIKDRAHLMEQKGLEWQIELNPEPLFVHADPQFLIQVLTNLLTNATNYTQPGGKIIIRTDREVVEDMNWVIIAIQDTGLGIPPEEQDRIFERFFRGEAGRNSGIPGTGLGLSICQEIVDQHQGRIELDSMVGEGSRFGVWLPEILDVEASGKSIS